jgi:hypothetical protein
MIMHLHSMQVQASLACIACSALAKQITEVKSVAISPDFPYL